MKKDFYESLGALKKLIFDFLEQRFQEGAYEIKMEKKVYENDGYVRCSLIIGGYDFECSVNVGHYVCWHVDEQLQSILRNIPSLEESICREVDERIKAASAIIREVRIAELEGE